MKSEKQLYQWDVNQYLTELQPTAEFVDYPIGNEVIRIKSDGTRCRIPDEALQTYGGKTCYERYPDGTYRAYSFNVLYAPKPPDYIYTPEERTTFEALTARVDAAIDEIKRRADSGEFTPVKGVDYFTNAEKVEMMESVSSGAVGEFRKVVDSATTEYNANASEKLTTYDTNAEQHTTDYNRNAAEKLEAYNSNHTAKVAEYNANAETKTAEFDSNAAALQTEVDRLRGECDNLASEIVDARYGADGVTYHSLGAAIRDQVTDLNSDVDDITANMTKDVGPNLLNPTNIDVWHVHQKGGIIVENPNFCAYVMNGVSEGEVYSVWKKNSRGLVESFLSTYVTAWVGSTAIADKGATNAHEYTVPPDVTRIDFSINLSSIEGQIMIVKGTEQPSKYEDYYNNGWIAKDEFIPNAIRRISSLESKRNNLNIYNVKDYGAKGDGLTDDTNAILSALTNGAGKKVYIPSGTYIINGKITIPSNTIIFGDGETTILKIPDNAEYWKYAPITWRAEKGTQYSFITTEENSQNIVLCDFVVDGGTRKTTDGIWGLTIYKSNHCLVENVSARNINYEPTRTNEVYGFGIFVFHSDDVIIRGSKSEYCGYENIGGEFCNHVTVEDCYIGTAWRVPLQFHTGSHDIKIINNTIVSTDCPMTHSLITLHGRAENENSCVSDVLIAGNYLEGVTIDSASYPYRGGIQGVFGNEQNIRIVNNTFICSNWCIGNATDRHEGTYVYDGWFINNNTFNGKYGINMLSNNAIVKNNLFNTDNTAIALQSRTIGSARIINDNIFINNSDVIDTVVR